LITLQTLPGIDGFQPLPLMPAAALFSRQRWLHDAAIFDTTPSNVTFAHFRLILFSLNNANI